MQKVEQKTAAMSIKPHRKDGILCTFKPIIPRFITLSPRLVAMGSLALRHVPNGGEQSFFGGLDIARMNVKRSPVTNRVVLVRGDGDDAEFRELPEECVTNVGAFAALFCSNNHEIGRGTFHGVVDL